MNFAPMLRQNDWRHTHNASLRGRIIQLCAEQIAIPGCPDLTLLFERDCYRPSWWMWKGVGAIRRVRATSLNDHGVIVEVAERLSA
jgi:hypothetical protein